MIFILLTLVAVAAGQTCSSTTHCRHTGPAVCGSDGRTYLNTCYLSHAICLAKLQGRYIRLAHTGACRTTGTGSNHHTHCDEICDEEGSGVHKVCMSNGITYESMCDALNAQCNATHAHEHLTVIHSGECLDLHSACDHIHSQTDCRTQAKHYTCGTNGYTYQNDCYLREAQCRLSATADPIEILHEGPCHDTSTNGTRNVDCSQYADMSLANLAVEGQRVTMHHCPRVISTSLGGPILVSLNTTAAVCADGYTYYSECYFCSRMAATHKISYTQMNIPISHDGACKRITVVG